MPMFHVSCIISHISFNQSFIFHFFEALVKQLGKTAENTKQRIRRIRRAAQDVVKKAKDGKLEGISEDDSFRTGKEIDAVTEECINALNAVVDKKQASVMNV
jgi:ribosome recycling factor